jgi:hypothetical protein
MPPWSPMPSTLIVSRSELGPILRGEQDEYVIRYEPPPVGSVRAIQAKVGGQTLATVKILDHWPCVHGGHVVRFRLEEKDDLRLLDRRPWRNYTDDPRMALRSEGEAPPRDVTDRYALEADQWGILEGGRREQERRERWNRVQRIKRVEALSRLTGVDVSTDLRAIDRRLQAAEQKLGRLAA